MMKRPTVIVYLLCALSSFLFVPDALADDKIKIGIAQTSTDDPFSKQMAFGVNLAVNKINDGGGILGHEVEIIERRDECQPGRAMNIAYQFMEEGVGVVVGHQCADSALAASRIYNEYGILLVSPTVSAPELTKRDYPYIHRLCGRTDFQGAIIGQFMSDRYDGEPLASLYMHERGRILSDQIDKNGTVSFSKDVSDFAEHEDPSYERLFSEISRSGARALVISGFGPSKAVTLIRQFSTNGGIDKYGFELVFDEAVAASHFTDPTVDWLDGTTFNTNCYLPVSAADADTDDTIFQFQCPYCASRHELDPLGEIGWALHAHAAVEVIAHAMMTAGVVDDSEKLLEVLRSIPADTSIGSVVFDKMGDMQIEIIDGYVEQHIYGWYMFDEKKKKKWTRKKRCKKRG